MIRHARIHLLLLVCALLLGGCLSAPPFRPASGGSDDLLFRVMDDDGGGGRDAARYAPLFAPQDPKRPLNRIGTPSARLDSDGAEVITINPQQSTLYHQAIDFEVAGHPFTNHVYRVHFEKVPWAFKASHISMGDNVGLLVIVTVDADGTPLLMTTVHSCGCYLTFFPTNHLPRSAYPEDQPLGDTQKVWGERPPAMIGFPLSGDLGRPVIHLRDGTHRVADITPFNPDIHWATVPMALVPMASLEHLPMDGTQTSFFHTSGPRKGYVKGAHKSLEFIFVSWWTWDAHVGHDKRYAPAGETGKVFYTSLKPWNRKASDLWDFPNFLKFWGWNLQPARPQ